MARSLSNAVRRSSAAALLVGLVLGVAACDQVGVSTTSPNTQPTLLEGTGTATLSWTVVTQNTNGTPAVIAGYQVFYGTSPSAMTNVIVVPGGGAMGYIVPNLGVATWYFAVAAYTPTGVVGEMSNIASKTISSN
jgi:hypothetical protein